MIELLQFAPGLGLMNPSPFCMKVEVFLRLAGLPYRCVNGALPLRAPKGKLPVLRHDGELVADSAAIIAFLQRRYHDRLPSALRVEDRGELLALRRLAEDHLYFAVLWLRWIDEAGWNVVRPVFFAGLPAPLRAPVAGLVRRKMRRDLVGQGTGRHRPEEIAATACDDLDAIDAILGAKPFFLGDEPGAIDASLYAFLANLLWAPIDGPVRTHVQGLPRLVGYCERMKARVGVE